MNVLHRNPSSYSENVTDHYAEMGSNWMFNLDILDGARVCQVNRDTNTAPTDYIWGSPIKDPIEALHDCLNKCIKFHISLIEGEEYILALEKKESKEASAVDEELEDDEFDPID